jgi:GLPGLI family protein
MVFLCNVFLSNAQEKKNVMRYEYQMSFPKSDSSDAKEVKESYTEIIYLDILNGESRFLSEGNVKKEETLQEYTTGSKKDADSQSRIEALKAFKSRVAWNVYKKGAQLESYISSGVDMYNVVESSNLIKWSILPDMEEYEGMKVQKAVGELSGRTWTVWFTQDIPLIDGPYKFKNLPGFVVKAEDSTGDYRFELLKSAKVVTTYWLATRHEQAMKIDKKQWDKIRNIDANKSIFQMMSEKGFGSAVIKIVDENGKDITDDKLKKKVGKEDRPIEFY